MARVRCRFLGARTLKDESKTGMIIFPKNADKHTLVDLEGDCYLTNDPVTPDQGKLALLADIKDKVDRLLDFINSQEREERKEEDEE